MQNKEVPKKIGNANRLFEGLAPLVLPYAMGSKPFSVTSMLAQEKEKKEKEEKGNSPLFTRLSAGGH